MSNERWQRGWSIFHEALAKHPDARAAFLDAACANDSDLLAEVKSLLAAHDSRADFLQQAPLVSGTLTAGETLVGQRVGPYLIRRILGQGGMGVVCEAEQEGEIHRRVALKLIRFGMETQEVVARFSAERQALALMNHPNIATAYEVGVTDEGRPFFAMEHVDGRPITEFCDEHRLPVRERIELFLQVCDAVQHAHQKGIIHRDLKPSNVLVAVRDDKPALKVIDFGVAKAVNQRLTDRSFYTEIGHFIGTPEYMSPEQAGVSGLDVDTRTDIYSLGVLFFELLVGALPVDSARLRDAGFADIARVLFGEEPPRPSQKFSAMGADRESAAHNRRTRPTTLMRDLRGDLDWIAIKAMERDRNRRYATASELAADVSRYLADEPVIAGPPTAGYRVRKFVARHRVAVSAAAAFVVVTVAFAVTMAISSARTTRALGLAQAERDRAEQVSTFLVDLFKVSNPGEARGNAITAREVLDEGAVKIADRLTDQPEQRARLLDTIGNVYTNLGLYQKAEPLLTEALDLRRKVLGPEHADVAATLGRLGNLLLSKGDYRQALALYRETLEMRRRIHGPEHVEVAESLNNMGRALRGLGEYKPAKQAFEEALAIRIKVGPADDQETAATLVNLGQLTRLLADYEASESFYHRALEMQRRLFGDKHIDTSRTQNSLANLYFERGDDAAAEPLFRESLASMRAIVGDEHPELASQMNNFGTLLRRTRQYDAAEDMYRRTLAIRRKMLGERNPEVAVASSNLAGVFKDKGDLAGAETLYRQSLDIFRAALGERHVNYATVLHHVGDVLSDKRDPRAEAVVQDALARKRAVLAPDHPSTATTLALAGHLRAERGDRKGAEPMLREALASLRKALPETHPRVAEVKGYLGACLLGLKRHEEAEPLLRESWAVLSKSGGVYQVKRTLKYLVDLYSATGNTVELDRHRALLAAAR